MSIFGALMRAGMSSDGRNVDVFNGNLTALNIGGVRGYRYYVDPTSGSDSYSGTKPNKAFATLTAAYEACVSGRGDVIEVFAPGTTSAGCTTYLTDSLDWTKHGITVIGHSAPGFFAHRARVANKGTTAEDLAYLIDVQGNNNAFYNISITNYGTNAAAVGGLKVTGDRNYFERCHILGGGHGTPGSLAEANSLELGGNENTFMFCRFGTDTFSRVGTNAMGEILLKGNASAGTGNRNRFYFCETLAQVTSGQTAYGAVKGATSDCIQTNLYFYGCIFQAFMLGAISNVASWFIGTAPNNGFIIVDKCGRIGFGSWDAATGNDRVYVIGATDGATAGLATVAS